MQNRPEKQAMGWLEKAELERRGSSLAKPRLGHGSLVQGVNCEDPATHEIHLDSVC